MLFRSRRICRCARENVDGTAEPGQTTALRRRRAGGTGPEAQSNEQAQPDAPKGRRLAAGSARPRVWGGTEQGPVGRCARPGPYLAGLNANREGGAACIPTGRTADKRHRSILNLYCPKSPGNHVNILSQSPLHLVVCSGRNIHRRTSAQEEEKQLLVDILLHVLGQMFRKPQ